MSNFSLPGFESRHNQCYWTGKTDFAAYGMGATSFTNGYRITRPRTLSKYYKYIDLLEKNENVGELLQVDAETEKNRKVESILMGRLRTKQGIAWS